MRQAYPTARPPYPLCVPDDSSDETVAGRWGGTDVKFGEDGARRTTGNPLRLPQLLSAQHLESAPPAHDELLFITIHQVYELWFQQLLHEADGVRDALMATRADSGGRGLWCAR